jgi:hypothetical protein
MCWPAHLSTNLPQKSARSMPQNSGVAHAIGGKAEVSLGFGGDAIVNGVKPDNGKTGRSWRCGMPQARPTWRLSRLRSYCSGAPRADTMDSTQIEAMYQIVVQGFADLGASNPQCVSRSILLRNMFYVGQVFRCEGWRAVWMIDGNSVEFYDTAGTLAKSASLAGETVNRKAA